MHNASHATIQIDQSNNTKNKSGAGFCDEFSGFFVRERERERSILSSSARGKVREREFGVGSEQKQKNYTGRKKPRKKIG